MPTNKINTIIVKSNPLIKIELHVFNKFAKNDMDVEHEYKSQWTIFYFPTQVLEIDVSIIENIASLHHGFAYFTRQTKCETMMFYLNYTSKSKVPNPWMLEEILMSY